MAEADAVRRRVLGGYGLLLAGTVGLLAANAFTVGGGRWPAEVLGQQLDLGQEANFAAWFSSGLLLIAGLAALLNAQLAGTSASTPRMHGAAWVAVAALCVLLSADEVARLHEWTGDRFTAVVGEQHPLLRKPGLNESTSWLLILGPFIVASALALGLFFLRCMRGDRVPQRLAMAGLCFWLIALASEYVEGRLGRLGRPRGWQLLFEEGGELLGTTLMLIAFVEVLRARLASSRGLVA